MNKNIQCYFFGNLKMFNKIQWVDTQTRYGNYFTYQKNCSSTTFVTQKKKTVPGKIHLAIILNVYFLEIICKNEFFCAK